RAGAAPFGIRLQLVLVRFAGRHRLAQLLERRKLVTRRIARRVAVGNHVAAEARSWKEEVERVLAWCAVGTRDAVLVMPHDVVREDESGNRRSVDLNESAAVILD